MRLGSGLREVEKRGGVSVGGRLERMGRVRIEDEDPEEDGEMSVGSRTFYGHSPYRGIGQSSGLDQKEYYSHILGYYHIITK